MLYKEWLSSWLENYVQPSAKQRTYTRYKEIVDQHIVTQLGELDLSEITPYILQCYVTELLKSGNLRTGKGLSANSVNAIITVIQNTLKTAYSLGIISEYIGDKIKRPRASEKKIEVFSVSEQKKIEQYILNEENTRLVGVLICLYTGIRIGELLALEWSDIDMSKGELRVNKTCHYGKDENGVFGRITDIPKTQSSIRTIPIPKQLMPHLREEKKKSRSTHIVSNGTTKAEKEDFIKDLRIQLDTLVHVSISDAQLKNNLRKLYETVKYTPPVSKKCVYEIEEDISSKVAALKKAVQEENVVKANGLIDDITNLIRERKARLSA